MQELYDQEKITNGKQVVLHWTRRLASRMTWYAMFMRTAAYSIGMRVVNWITKICSAPSTDRRERESDGNLKSNRHGMMGMELPTINALFTRKSVNESEQTDQSDNNNDNNVTCDTMDVENIYPNL